MSKIQIVVGIKAKADKEDELRRDLVLIVKLSRKEPGNIRYDLYEDHDELGRFVFVEEWASIEERTAHHEHAQHIKYFHENGVLNVEKTEFGRILKGVVA
ncbi:MAG TPA: putative quinol monooxygenase [Microvirga sp.]|jgi:quinol monooxygenase YgiN|nr:putative quinol monooxygenase [Microvirga sp.]